MANFFPRWTNWLPLKLAICGVVLVCGLTGATWYYVTPKYTRVGYEPIQPVPFPHDIHVSQLGMDCRYYATGIRKISCGQTTRFSISIGKPTM